MRRSIDTNNRIVTLLILLFSSLAFNVSSHAGAIRQFNVAGGIQPNGIGGTFTPTDDCPYPGDPSYAGGPSGCDNPQPSSVGFQINFFGTPRDQVWVNANGNITFTDSLQDFTPAQINGSFGIIAPFWADVDTRGAGSALTTFGQGALVGTSTKVFYVNWINVGYWDEHTTPLNSFQLVLIDRSRTTGRCGDFDIEFNYDQILWETGDYDGGVGGLGGISARAGYGQDDGTPAGVSYELPGSGVNGALLDGSPSGLIHGSINSQVPGRYLFNVRGHAHIEVAGISDAIEGNTPGMFRISRTGPVNSDLNVVYDWDVFTDLGYPPPPDDNWAHTTVAIIPIGQSFLDLQLTPDNDNVYNIAARKIWVRLHEDPCSYIRDNDLASVTLFDDDESVDDQVLPYWSITTSRDAREGGSSARIVVSRIWRYGTQVFTPENSQAATASLSVTYHAASSADLATAVPQQVTVPAGVLSITLDLAAVDDSIVEGTEDFDITVVPQSGGRVEPGKGSTTVHILDNDFPPPGTLDTAFNPTINGSVSTTAIQSDGKILIGGAFSLVNNVTRNSLARLNGDGSLDTAFAPIITGGYVSRLAVQSNQKIVIVGNFTSVGSYNTGDYATVPGIARLNSGGTRDTSFSIASMDTHPSIVALQSDGKILIGGTFNTISVYPYYYKNYARLSSSGYAESSFNPGSPGYGTDGSVYALAVHPNDGSADAGKVYVGGAFQSAANATRQNLARLNSNGSIDSNFNFSNTGSGPNGPVNAIAVESSDGKTIVGGTFTMFGNQTYINTVRLNTDSSLDAQFAPQPNGTVYAALLQADGKIVVGGTFTTIAGTSRSRIARLNISGFNDDSFNPGSGANDGIQTLSLQSDGKIIAGGWFTSFNGVSRNYLVRVNGD